MHTRGILYRDLKLENVLIGEDGYPVLVDFGFVKKLEENKKAFTICGSPFYIAPEVLLGTGE
jgi:serine/threonine protein kinase